MFNNIPTDNLMRSDKLDLNSKVGMYNVETTHINRLEIPITLTPRQATFDDIAIHMIYRQRLSQRYTERLLETAQNMTKHIIPVDLEKPDFLNFMQHMDYCEQIEQVSPCMLKRQWTIMQHILTAYGIPYGKGTIWNYRPPSIPPPKPRYIPLPDEMHKILHYKYSKDKLKNACLHYPLMHSVIFGWRNPSEMCLLKTTDIDFDNGSVIITEKKKHYKQRKLITKYQQILAHPRLKSLKNWIDIWRTKITTQHSKDYLYIRWTDGKPIGEMQFTRLIEYYVQPVFPKFQLYSTRHFCATATLIREYLDTGHWNKNLVKNWLGHENDNTTDTYIRYAEQYLHKAGYDWFKRILKNHNKNVVEANPLESKKHEKTLVSDGNPSIMFGDFQTTSNIATGEKQLRKHLFSVLLNFQPISFFFSLPLGVGC